MRKLIFSVACSLDLYITGRDHGIGWILQSNEGAAAFTKFWQQIDTILMGRKTYDFALSQGGAPPTPGITTYVFSRTLKAGDDPNAEIVNADAAEFVGQLKQQPGKQIFMMGGGQLAQSLFDADLIDELRLNIHPILLGGGVPLFRPLEHPIDLKLTESTALKNGCVLTTYQVKHRRGRS